MQALAERARIVLAAADGFKNKEIAVKIGVCAATAAVETALLERLALLLRKLVELPLAHVSNATQEYSRGVWRSQ
jgi:hypothetical protein